MYKKNLATKIVILLAIIGFFYQASNAQTTYGASGSYGLRKLNPSYTGKAINVRRTCDNATLDIGFSSCGDLDITSLQKFVIASNPLSSISSSAATAYGMRKLNCSFTGSCINVRRSCDNATTDIGFTSDGDIDTTALKTFVIASNPLSALSSSSAAAYSLRKLNCSYAGKAIKVRRSSDNTTQDIGFTSNGDLDTSSLKTFVGANNGFITTWYDQSGNGNNATQATNGNQPKIVSAGTVNRQNSKPTAVFDGSSSYMTVTYAASMDFSSASTTNCVFAKTTASPTGDAAIFDQVYAPSNISVALSWNNGSGASAPLSIGYYPGSWQYAALSTDVSTNTNCIISGTILSGAGNTTVIKIYQNSTLINTASNKTTVGAQASQSFNIGKRWDLGNYAPMNMQELILFKSALSTTDQQYLEYGQSLYYSISGGLSDITTFPASTPSAYVTKWYDQSGNSRDASQATSANQPRIINAGIIDRYNGVPSMFFNNTGAGGYSICLQTANLNVYTSKACFLGVAAVNTNLTYNCLVVKTNNNNYPSPFDFYYNTGAGTTTLLTGNGSSANFFTCSKNFNAGSGLHIWTYQANGTAANGVNAYYDASTQIITNQTASYFGDNNSPVCLGARSDGVTGLNGWISEVLTFNSIPSATDIGYLEYSEGAYYSISGPSLGTLPSSPASAYVTTWYDQSGNGKNITQSTTTKQPRIVNAGTVSLQGSLPAIYLDGSNYYMSESTLSIGNPYTSNVVATRTANGGSGGYQRLVNMSATGDSYGYMGVLSGNYATFTGNGSGTWNDIAADAPSTSMALNTQSILSMAVSSGASGLVPYFNGTALTAKNGTAATATGFLIGAPYNSTNTNQLWTGNISEFTIFSSALSTTRRTLLETNQGAYYGLTPSNSKYTAASGYTYYVTGVGRTSSTDSVADSRQSGGMGFIVGTTASDYLKDNGDYITAGMSCPTAAVTTSLYMPAGATSGYERWLNDWYINKTDVSSNGGNLQVFFDFSDYGVSGTPANASNYQLWGRANTTSNFTVVPTSAVTISGDRVIFTVSAANLGTTGYYTIGTIDYLSSPLPIELLDFTAVPNGNKVDVKWITETEINNAYFTIEKSQDGQSFTKVMDVPGAGNSNTAREYFETDYQPYSGTSYYRLKQTDYNGQYKYFNVVPVNFTSSKNITFYPNPVGSVNEININIQGHQNEEVLVVLRDVQGREFFSKVYMITQGSQVFIVDADNTIPPGAYIIVASSNDKVYNQKIIVQGK